MNMQALMKQAQQMQKEITNVKSEIDNMEFEGVGSLVSIKVNGKKEVLKVTLSVEIKDAIDDIELIEDMILVAINDAFRKVDATTEQKMGKYSSMMQGLM